MATENKTRETIARYVQAVHDQDLDTLSAMQHDTPDIVLIDFNMPVRDGLHLAADLRKLSPQIPIAIISANHQQEVINRATALGATFLPKPVGEKELSAFLNAATRDLQDAAS